MSYFHSSDPRTSTPTMKQKPKWTILTSGCPRRVCHGQSNMSTKTDSNGKWLFIVDFPIKNGDFPNYSSKFVLVIWIWYIAMKTQWFLSRSELKRAPCISDFVRMFELLPKRACPSQQLITQARMSGEVQWRVVQNRPICKNKNIRQIRTSTQKYTHTSHQIQTRLLCLFVICDDWSALRKERALPFFVYRCWYCGGVVMCCQKKADSHWQKLVENCWKLVALKWWPQGRCLWRFVDLCVQAAHSRAMHWSEQSTFKSGRNWCRVESEKSENSAS